MRKDRLIEVHYNPTASYAEKPNAGRVTAELDKVYKISLPELAEGLAGGHNCRPSVIDRRTKAFKRQILFMYDFDNDGKQIITPERAVQIAREHGLTPCFGYHSHNSYNPQKGNVEKFRLAFVLDRYVDNDTDRQKVHDVFASVYGDMIDSRCFDYNRLMFGGHEGKVLCGDFRAVNKLDDILSIWKPKTPQRAPHEATEPKKRNTKIKPRAKPSSSTARNLYLIQSRDKDGLRKALGRTEPTVFNNLSEFFRYIYSDIDIDELLGIDNPKSFSCVFPEKHKNEDKHPSASIYVGRAGIQRYKCFGCNCDYNVKQLLELLGDFKSEWQVLEFIKYVYNLQIVQTSWSIEQTENINAIQRCLYDTGENGFKQLCPTADKTVTRVAREVYSQMLEKAKLTIYPERFAEDSNIIFYMSIDEIMAKSQKGCKSQVINAIKLLQYHQLIIGLNDDEIPKEMLIKAYRSANEKVVKTKNKKMEKGKCRRINFYEIPSWVISQLKEIEQQGQSWKAHNYRVKNISYEAFKRAEGEAVANRLYPQYIKAKGTQTNEQKQASDTEYEKITDIIISLIQDKGYCTESEILAVYGNSEAKKRKLNIAMPDIMQANNLSRQRLNKALRQKYGIDTAPNSHPYIYFME